MYHMRDTVPLEVSPIPTGARVIVQPGDVGVESGNLLPRVACLNQGGGRDRSGSNNSGEGGIMMLLNK